MVEDIFALAVRFEVGGRGGDERAGGILDEQGRGLPAGARSDAARLFEQRQEGVADERIAPVVKSVPRCRIDRGDAGAERYRSRGWVGFRSEEHTSELQSLMRIS